MLPQSGKSPRKQKTLKTPKTPNNKDWGSNVSDTNFNQSQKETEQQERGTIDNVLVSVD
jgi:hypothetical protein